MSSDNNASPTDNKTSSLDKSKLGTVKLPSSPKSITVLEIVACKIAESNIKSLCGIISLKKSVST